MMLLVMGREDDPFDLSINKKDAEVLHRVISVPWPTRADSHPVERGARPTVR